MLAPIAALADTLTVHAVAPGVWAIEGPATQRDPENLGNNATFGLIETGAGAVLVDPGGTWEGAAALHAVVDDLTDQPVTHVVNTGGQDHRWLGNGYWQAHGATMIASEAAVDDQRSRASMQMTMLSQLVGEGFAGTEPAFADVTFTGSYEIELGDRHIEIHHPGPAHTRRPPSQADGAISSWLRAIGMTLEKSAIAWSQILDGLMISRPKSSIPSSTGSTDLADQGSRRLEFIFAVPARRYGELVDTFRGLAFDEAGLA